MNKVQIFFSTVWVFLTNFILMLIAAFISGCMLTTPIALIVLWIWEAVGTLPTFIANNYYPLFMLYAIPATICIMIVELLDVTKKTKKAIEETKKQNK